MKRTFKFVLTRAFVKYNANDLAKAKALDKKAFIDFLENQATNTKITYLLETNDCDKACNFFKQVKTPMFEKANEEMQKTNIYHLMQFVYEGNKFVSDSILYTKYPEIGEVVG